MAARAIGGTGSKTFGQQTLRLGRSEGIADLAKNLQSHTIGNLRRVTQSSMMQLTSGGLGFLPGILQASLFDTFSGGSGSLSRGSSSPVMRNNVTGTPQWASNLERLFKEPLPVRIVKTKGDALAMLEARRESINQPKVIEGTSRRIPNEKADGLSLGTLAMAGFGGLLIAALNKLRDTINNWKPDADSWFDNILPNDVPSGLGMGATVLSAIGVAPFIKRFLFGEKGSLGGMKNGKWVAAKPATGGLFGGIGNWLKKQKVNWPKTLSSWKGASGLGILGTMGGIGLSLVAPIIDGVQGYFKAEDWNVSKFSATVGTFLGGVSSGAGGALEGAIKWGFLGGSIGSVVPGVGNIAGFLIGSILGGVMGYFGGERISKILENIGDSVSNTAETIWNFNFQESLNNETKKILGAAVVNRKTKRMTVKGPGKGHDVYDASPENFGKHLYFSRWDHAAWGSDMHMKDGEFLPLTKEERDVYKRLTGKDWEDSQKGLYLKTNQPFAKGTRFYTESVTPNYVETWKDKVNPAGWIVNILSKGWDYFSSGFLAFANHAAGMPMSPEQQEVMKNTGMNAGELKKEAIKARKALNLDKPGVFLDPGIQEKMKRLGVGELLYEYNPSMLIGQAGGGGVIAPAIIHNHNISTTTNEMINQQIQYGSDTFNLQPVDYSGHS